VPTRGKRRGTAIAGSLLRQKRVSTAKYSGVPPEQHGKRRGGRRKGRLYKRMKTGQGLELRKGELVQWGKGNKRGQFYGKGEKQEGGGVTDRQGTPLGGFHFTKDMES